MSKTAALVQAKQLIPAGIAGAATVASMLLCMVSFSFILTSDLAILTLHTGVLAIFMGCTAALLTSCVWRKRSRMVAYLLGLVGFVGGFSANFWLVDYLWKRPYRFDLDKLEALQRFILFDGVTIGAAILAQVLALLFILALQALFRLAHKTNTPA